MGTLLDSLLAGVGLVTDIANLKMAKENQQYQRNMQTQAWAREDNAVQRRAADLKAAGINPLLAAGQAASSSSPISVGAPQMGLTSAKAGLEAAMALTRQKQDIAVSAAEERRIKEATKELQYTNEMHDRLRSMVVDNEGTRAIDAMADMQYQNAVAGNYAASKQAEMASSLAEKAAIDAANASRELEFKRNNNVYGSEASELASMSKYLDGLSTPGDYKGMVYELGNKILDRVLKK